MATNSTNWAKPQGPTQGTQSLYNAHINYNTHIFYNGTYVPGQSPTTNFSKTSPTSTNFSQATINATNWS